MPVLPLVGSTIVPPGRSAPSRSAASIIARQMRSFTLPPGLKLSSFAHTSPDTPWSCGNRVSRTTGVAPIRSSAERATCEGSAMPVSNGGVAGESIESVVVIFPGALGDFLLALPALRALRARHAAARATFVVQPSLAALVGLAGVADAVASVDGAETAGLFSGDRTPAWLADRPRVYSWLGADDAEMRGRIARGARFFRTERRDGPVHAAVAYARALRVPTARAALA